jgi:putative membrane protein
MRIYLTLIFIAILLVIAFIFGSQNAQPITLNYLIARSEMSLALAVSVFTTIGIILGLLLALLWKLLRAVKPKQSL